MVERALRRETLGMRAGKPPHAHIQLGDLDHEPEFAEAVDICPNVAGTRVLRDVEVHLEPDAVHWHARRSEGLHQCEDPV